MNFDENRCTAEIDIQQFLKNYITVKNTLPKDCRMMAVLKGNAYGHGAAILAKELEVYTNDWIAVASLGEAVELRDSGIQKEILILGYTLPLYANTLSDLGITQAIISLQYANELAEKAKEKGVIVKGHLAIDTGMSRIGIVGYGTNSVKYIEEAVAIYKNPNLNITGIFTHFSSAYGIEKEDEEFTRLQYKRFLHVCNSLENRSVQVGIRHCNNSPSIVNYPEYALDMCRGGTLLFGLFDKAFMKRELELPLILRFKTIVAMIKEIKKGTPISYSRTAVADKDTRLAVLAAGWYDGYPRQLGNKGSVLIRGKKFPIIGKVCMDICMADITGHPDIKPGDEVVLLGKQGESEITCRQLYEPIGIGPGSISSGISNRVPRIYRK